MVVAGNAAIPLIARNRTIANVPWVTGVAASCLKMK
jgi:hypothetical protein